MARSRPLARRARSGFLHRGTHLRAQAHLCAKRGRDRGRCAHASLVDRVTLGRSALTDEPPRAQPPRLARGPYQRQPAPFFPLPLTRERGSYSAFTGRSLAEGPVAMLYACATCEVFQQRCSKEEREIRPFFPPVIGMNGETGRLFFFSFFTYRNWVIELRVPLFPGQASCARSYIMKG